MDSSQTPSDYKDYFNNKFISLFKNLLSVILENLPSECKERDNIVKINNLVGKLNYDKIIKKMEENTKLVETLISLDRNDFNPSICSKFYCVGNKYWTIMPSLHINEILIKISDYKVHKQISDIIHNLHICAVTYNKVIEQIDSVKEGKDFNPFDSIGNVAENLDVETLFKGVEVKNISAYEMLMESIINQQMDSKMTDYMNNIKEDDVNEAAAKLNDVLNSENFNGNKHTSKILADMLENIKSEVINLKNNNNDTNSENMKGKQGVEQLLGIAQKVAGNMMGNIKNSNVSVLEIWDATSSLAKNTVQSDALNIVDNLIRSNIESNLSGVRQVQEVINESMKNNNESTKTSGKKSKSNKTNKNKE